MAANTQPQFRPGFRPQYRGGGRGGGTRRPANGPRPQGNVQNLKQTTTHKQRETLKITKIR